MLESTKEKKKKKMASYALETAIKRCYDSYGYRHKTNIKRSFSTRSQVDTRRFNLITSVYKFTTDIVDVKLRESCNAKLKRKKKYN